MALIKQLKSMSTRIIVIKHEQKKDSDSNSVQSNFTVEFVIIKLRDIC